METMPGAGWVIASLLGLTCVGCGHGECRAPRAPGAVADMVERDPTRVDPQHYRVELENEHVRIVRAHYGPREEAAVHDHVCGRVIVNLNRQHEVMQSPDGKTTEVDHRAGEASWSEGRIRHSGRNAENEGFDVIMIDVKSACPR